MIKIYQIFYKEEHKQFLEPNVIPYDNSEDDSLKFEYGVMLKEYKKGFTEDFTGFISWKWKEKSKIPLSKFTEVIENTPGYDCYCFNPHSWVKDNIWLQGDASSYKDIKMSNITQRMFEKLQYDHHILHRQYDLSNFAFCNYWVANKKFWDEYIKFIEPFSNLMIGSNTAYNNLFFDKEKPLYGYYPYIIERLWSEFIYLKQHELKTKIFYEGNLC